MEKLKQMLDAYRNKEREFPTYDELVAVAEMQSNVLSALRNIVASANSAQFCYDRRPENFASALTGLGYDVMNANLAIAAAEKAV